MALAEQFLEPLNLAVVIAGDDDEVVAVRVLPHNPKKGLQLRLKAVEDAGVKHNSGPIRLRPALHFDQVVFDQGRVGTNLPLQPLERLEEQFGIVAP